ncbi:MAG: hypothetical protein NVS3B10_19760 [Polyangiales bacterium]
MQWRMIGRRSRTATWTIVGDPAQSSWPYPQEAQAALDEVLAGKPRRRHMLTVNYRNPAEIAEVTGLTKTNVTTKVHRIKALLAKRFAME